MVNRKPILFGIFLAFVFLAYISPVKGNFAKEVDPIADCLVREHWPNDNYGSYDYLGVGADLWGDQEATYLKFVVPSVDTKITRVYISTYWYSFMVETPLSLSASLVLFNWSENVITWNNRPSGVQVLETDTSVGDGEYFIIDIDLSLATQGSMLSLIIYENAPFKPDGLQGNSREDGYKSPELIVEYEVPLGIVATPIAFVAIAVAIVTTVQYRKYVGRKRKKIEAVSRGTEFREQTTYSKGSLLVYSFFFFIFVIGLLGFNALMQNPPTLFLIVPIIEFLESIALPINLTLTGLLCASGIPFTLSLWRFFAVMRQKIKNRSKTSSDWKKKI